MEAFSNAKFFKYAYRKVHSYKAFNEEHNSV